MSKHIVVVGNGMVGQRFVETLREADPEARITVLGDEPRPAYDRVRLSAFFSGTSAEELTALLQALLLADSDGESRTVGARTTDVWARRAEWCHRDLRNVHCIKN